MTNEERDQLERQRRKREDEMIILLLLLLPPLARATDLMFDLANLRRVFASRFAREIAESMADAHLDAFAQAGGFRFPSKSTLIQQYMATGREAAEAMADAVAKAVASGATFAEALQSVGYTKSNSTGLEQGAERNIVTATAAGFFLGRVSIIGIENVTALEHITFIDEGTTDICLDRVGLKLAASDPYWLTNWVSLHWGCRSSIDVLTGPQTLSTVYPHVPPMEGFGRAPAGVVEMLRRAAVAA